jgi:hypothetical protein
VFSIGFNIRPPILAILATYIEKTTGTARIYTLMSTTEGLAHLIGSPALEAIWGVAVERGPAWYTLPFQVLAVSLLSGYIPEVWTTSKLISDRRGVLLWRVCYPFFTPTGPHWWPFPLLLKT